MADTKVRRDVWSLELSADAPPWHETLLAYARAVDVMRRRPPDDPTSWTRQAQLHRCCPRGTWFLLPWLRMRLWYFERIVRAAVVEAGGPAGWALPYWNYTDGPPGSAALPRAFAAATLPDGTPNPLRGPDGERPSWLDDGMPLPSAVTSTARALAAPAYCPELGGPAPALDHLPAPAPAGRLEVQPHDTVRAVLGRGASADPVLPLHLANVDRLWAVWLAAGEHRANPVLFDWADHEFHFVDADGRERGLTCGQAGELANLDYVYDGVPAAGGNSAVALSARSEADWMPALPGAGAEIASGAGEGIDLGLAPSRVPLRRASGAPGLAEAAREAGAALAPRVYLHLEALGEATPGSVWEVRVDGGRLRVPADEREAPVGTIAFPGRAAVERRFVFDITDAVDDLEAAGDWDDRAIAVSFHAALPAGLAPEPPPAARVRRVFVTRG